MKERKYSAVIGLIDLFVNEVPMCVCMRGNSFLILIFFLWIFSFLFINLLFRDSFSELFFLQNLFINFFLSFFLSFFLLVYHSAYTSCQIISYTPFHILFVCLYGFYGISTFVGYLIPNPFLCN